MNAHEQSLKPLVLDLLTLVERTLALADDGETAVSHLGAVAQANDHVRAALDMLPLAASRPGPGEAELESLPPALPADAVELSGAHELAAETPPPSNDWLLGDDDGFGLG